MSSFKKVNMYKNVYYYKVGEHILHREDGPAIECINGDKFWYINGLLHREDGSACEYGDGDKFWYYHGEEINCKSNEEFLRLIKLKAFW